MRFLAIENQYDNLHRYRWVTSIHFAKKRQQWPLSYLNAAPDIFQKSSPRVQIFNISSPEPDSLESSAGAVFNLPDKRDYYLHLCVGQENFFPSGTQWVAAQVNKETKQITHLVLDMMPPGFSKHLVRKKPRGAERISIAEALNTILQQPRVRCRTLG